MPVQPAKFIQSTFRNGVGSFVQPCTKIVLRYCNWGGSSRGMRKLLNENIRQIAAENPEIEVVVQKKSGHPIVQGFYANGNIKSVCVRNYEPSKILEKISVVRNSSGEKLRKYNRAVESKNESVRGIWSPFHVDAEHRYRI
ncbi:54S ribosomal protein L51, mitochondrial [Wickerhamiella sorbophila]|uniref:Large ribosomal subunit protein mL43 n=1 Tax=Wickerhamiella sorbophila TaxID=45607 RepID=A0A2T0FMT3_9ASCO|nr:54S ribosomal protein L51, mitochondrial [Wickerhamiella sorbophila]PRT56308.1 54S ribosomal protein L51, mitochondrial [Wickerhamiella sorbophila]